MQSPPSVAQGLTLDRGDDREYHVTVEVADVTETHGKTVVTALASGNLPGSPAQLRYAFILEGGKVARLELH